MRPQESRREAGEAQGRHGDTAGEWSEPADAAATSATETTPGLRTSPLPGRGPGLLSRLAPFPPLCGRLPARGTRPGLGLCRLRLDFPYLLCNLLFFVWKRNTFPLSPKEGRASLGSAAPAVRPAGRARRGPPASGPRPRAAGCRPGGGGCSRRRRRRRRGGGWGGRAARRPPLLPPPQPPPPALPGVCFSLWSEAAVMADGGLWRRRRLL